MLFLHVFYSNLFCMNFLSFSTHLVIEKAKSRITNSNSSPDLQVDNSPGNKKRGNDGPSKGDETRHEFYRLLLAALSSRLILLLAEGYMFQEVDCTESVYCTLARTVPDFTFASAFAHLVRRKYRSSPFFLVQSNELVESSIIIQSLFLMTRLHTFGLIGAILRKSGGNSKWEACRFQREFLRKNKHFSLFCVLYHDCIGWNTGDRF